jgi:hypothetical protein
MRRSRLGRLYPPNSNPRLRRRLAAPARGRGRRAFPGLGERLGGRVRPADEEHPADQLRVGGRVPDLALERLNGGGRAALGRALGHPPGQGRLLLQGPQRAPQGRLQPVRLLGQKALGAPGVPDAAAEPQQIAVGELPEGPAALGAGEPGRGAGPVVSVGGAGFEFRHVRLLARLPGQAGQIREGRALGGQPGQQLRQLRRRHTMVHHHVTEGALGHARVHRVVRVLDDGQSAPLFDGHQSRRPVVQHPGQDDPDHLLAVAAGRGAEQGVGRRAVAVLAGPAGHPHVPRLDQQVVVRRGHVNAARPQRLPVVRVGGRQSAGPGEDPRQDARPVRRDVQDHAHGGRQVR